MTKQGFYVILIVLYKTGIGSILCITFNIEPIPVSEKIKETIKYSICEKFGLDSSIWDCREKNQTIVLVFEKIPEYLYLELKKIDNEWIKNKEYLNG